MSVVPPEFTPVFGVHSDPVTGISGGAFPLRGLESAFARPVTGTCTTRPLSWIKNALLFFPQCLYTPFTLSSFQIAVKRFDSFCNYTTKRTQKLRFCHIFFGYIRVGECEGAKPSSNKIECLAKPCRARRAISEAHTFAAHSDAKVTALNTHQKDPLKAGPFGVCCVCLGGRNCIGVAPFADIILLLFFE